MTQFLRNHASRRPARSAATLRVEALEDRAVPAWVNLGTLGHPEVHGAAAGSAPWVVVNDNGTEVTRFLAYDADFLGGVNVAVADVTGDFVVDIVTGAGTGGGPHVKVFDGATGALVRSFMAYDPAFVGGVNVAAADVTGDGLGDLVTGAGNGGGPHVQVFRGIDLTLVRSFMAYDPAFTGGVFVAAGDATDDRRAEIVTGAGPGGGPHIRQFDGATEALRLEFMALGDVPTQHGVRVDVRPTEPSLISATTAATWEGGVTVYDGHTGSNLGTVPYAPGSTHDVREWRGANSGVKTRERLAIRDRDTWAAFWQQLYAGGPAGAPGGSTPTVPAVPEVDFATWMVIAVSQGEQPSGGYAIGVAGLVRTGSDLAVYVRERTPTPGEPTNPMVTQPYHVLVIPRADGAVTFQDV